jgi:hypothetical protein
MFRRISLTAVERDGSGRMMFLDGRAAELLKVRLSDKVEGLPMHGCGQDMGFSLVYERSAWLWPKGFGCIGERCPSNDHSNGDRDYTVHGPTDETCEPENREPGPGETKDGLRRHWHRDGGYALRQRWL